MAELIRKTKKCILFTFSSPLCLGEGTGVEICWRLLFVQGTNYSRAQRGPPWASGGHNQLQQRNPTRCQKRQHGSKGSGKQNSSHPGLETHSYRETVLCHRAAQLRGRKTMALGVLCQNIPEGLWPRMTEKDIIHKAAGNCSTKQPSQVKYWWTLCK